MSDPEIVEVRSFARSILTAIAIAEEGDATFEKMLLGRQMTDYDWNTTNAAIGLLVRAFAVRIAALEDVDTATVLKAMSTTLDDSYN